ncbi:ATP-binding cassette subfamily B protein [Saccharothrix tamanrassetensis]|uniref:ATP-binding cassette subfamily B protein n=1 Tax=Saccharothrix tamanrassetensis TaxID=1051531 RepID=A0A841CNJ4_9PSEU|nr:ABC transporter ATP-binding protein [Saccharothrix tamanrassetensis]MBB5958483.1 ATP-binding cassette subfamily B protein [Saccharothrix tamanrassetensis]
MTANSAEDAPRQQNHWLRALVLLWRVSPPQMSGVLATTLVVALVPALNVSLTTHAVQSVADAVSRRDSAQALNQALLAAGAIAVVTAIAQLLTAARGYLETLLRYRMANSIQLRIMEKSVQLPLQDFEDAGTYDKLQRANRESMHRPYQIFTNLISTVSSAVSLSAVSVVLISWDVRIALLVMVAPLPSLAANIFFSRIIWKLEYDRSTDRRRVNYLQYLVTTDRNYKETRLFSLGHLFVGQFRDLVERFYLIDRKWEGRQAAATAALGMLSVATAAVAILFAVHVTVSSGTIGQFAGYVMAVTLVQTTIQTLVGSVAQLYEHNLFLGNLFSFLEKPARGPGTDGKRPFPKTLRKGIEFREVSFTYPGTDNVVLDRVNLFLPAGQCVALVGPNGAGKTTIVKLIARFYDCGGGSILIDDVPVEQYDVEDLRKNIGVIFQDFIQYEASALDNIGFGNLAARDDRAKVTEAARQAGALPFLEQLPKGLDTQLGRWFEEGRQLSGGQWQKVALSRAFLRDAPVMVLDEPTASIDAATEAEVFGRLKEIAGRATTLLIAHRFSTVRVADHIVVIDRGKVLEEGSHPELMARNGMYANLFQLQAAGYQYDVDDCASLQD